MGGLGVCYRSSGIFGCLEGFQRGVGFVDALFGYRGLAVGGFVELGFLLICILLFLVWVAEIY